jgi:hypothetical protein
MALSGAAGGGGGDSRIYTRSHVRMLAPWTVKHTHKLTVTDRFGPTVGWKLSKPSAIKSSWGVRQVKRIKFAAALAPRGAPWRTGAALALRGAGDASRRYGKLCQRREA